MPIERRSGHPKHLLLRDPFEMFVWDLVVKDGHGVAGCGW